MRPILTVAAFVFAVAVGSSAMAPAAGAQSDTHPKLPPGEGRDVMIRVCSGCHSPDIAADEQLDTDGWKKLVDQMAANGADGTEAEFEQIVRYLAAAFPPSK